ncbi:uncharacterized protein LOC118439000 isoform X1 [Folsomia candida]|nr:uncharacterized protein LOC118439000 isoform X1 [Folsomia candida]
MFFETAKPDPDVETFAVSFNRRDRIRLINPSNPQLVDIFKTTVKNAWPAGIRADRVYYGAAGLELHGSPWCTSAQGESIAAKQLVCHLIYAMKRIGFKLYASVDITGRKGSSNGSSSHINGQLDVLVFRKVTATWGN